MYDIEKEATFVVDIESMSDMLTGHALDSGYLDDRRFIRVTSMQTEEDGTLIIEGQVFRYLDN